MDVMQALKQSLLKICGVDGDGGKHSSDGAEAEVDEDDSGSGAMRTECGSGAKDWAGDERNDAAEGVGGGISPGDEGGAGAGSR